MIVRTRALFVGLFLLLLLIPPSGCLTNNPTQPNNHNPNLLWKMQINGGVSSPAIGPDGTVFIGGLNSLYAINSNGNLEWSVEIGESNDLIWSSPAIDEESTIYVGTLAGRFCAISSQGLIQWDYYTGDKIISSPAIGDDGSIYVGSDSLYAFSPDGAIKWRVPGYVSFSSPAIGMDGIIIVNSGNSQIEETLAINPDGTIRWRYPAGEHYSSPAIDNDGTIYIGSSDNKLLALNPDGSIKWSASLIMPPGFSSPVIGIDHNIYIGTVEGRIYAFDSMGIQSWGYAGLTCNGCNTSSIAVGNDGVLYVYIAHELNAINSAGEFLWKQTVGQVPGSFLYRSSPTVGSDGTIYISGQDGYLYAFKYTSSQLAASPWPKFRRDIKNSGRSN